MKLTTEIQKKISKLDTVSLTRKVQFGNFQEEKLEYAISLLKKRHVDIDSILAKKATKVIEEAIVTPEIDAQLRKDFPANIEDSPEFFAACETSLEPIAELVSITETSKELEVTEKPYTKKIEKAKSAKKTGKKEKRIYVAADGKEFTKSALMRRLIRLKNDIKPKELNEQLIDAGFEKAYHSEIQRCRQQMGVFLNKKE